MDWQGWYTIVVIGVVFVALVRSWGPPDYVLMGGSLLMGLANVITPAQVFSGFVNPGTLTIAALFVVASAMRETGALNAAGKWIFGRARTEDAGLIRMAIPVASMSAFFNNTPIVAMLMPVVSDWCRKNRVSPSRMLMPLSFMAILGGTCTLIGTSTNLAIDGLMKETVGANPELAESLRPIGLFEMAYVGVPFVVLGTIYMVLLGKRLLPDRKDVMEKLEASPREYMSEMQIQAGCPLIGQAVEEAGLRHLPGLFLTEILRGDEVISPVGPQQRLEEDDILTFSGVIETMVDLERIRGLVPVADEGYEVRAAQRRGQFLCEAVISQRSPLVGRNIREADFRAMYGAAVIAVHRGSERIRGRIGDIVLRVGDTLLLQTPARFSRVHHNNQDFYLVSDVEESRSVRHEKALLCSGLMVLLLVLMMVPSVEVVYAAFIVAGLMVVTRCIPAGEARKSVDWETVFTIGASFGLGHALGESGAAESIAGFFLRVGGGMGPYVLLGVVYVLTSVFAAVVSSKASAILMFPIALAIAVNMGADPRPFIMAVAFAAASSFATPLGYPTNLMVYAPGGYRFTDFTRVGLPLNCLLAIVAILLVPVVWPF